MSFAPLLGIRWYQVLFLGIRITVKVLPTIYQVFSGIGSDIYVWNMYGQKIHFVLGNFKLCYHVWFGRVHNITSSLGTGERFYSLHDHCIGNTFNFTFTLQYFWFWFWVCYCYNNFLYLPLRFCVLYVDLLFFRLDYTPRLRLRFTFWLRSVTLLFCV